VGQGRGFRPLVGLVPFSVLHYSAFIFRKEAVVEQFFVVYKRNRLMPAEFEGEKNDVVDWLIGHRSELWDLEVCSKITGAYVDAAAFIMLNTKVVMPGEAPTPMLGSAEEKMLREDLMDPHVHARNTMVHHLIRRAVRLAREPGYDPELLAKNTTQEVVRLFY
jgi:hypothetical protein